MAEIRFSEFFRVLSESEAAALSPTALAFIGDAVHSLFVRTSLCLSHDCRSGKLHKLAAAEVNAGAQSKGYELIKDALTEEEDSIYKRGRNAEKSSVPKNADIVDYRRASGLEAVFGYLYLTGRQARLFQLLGSIYGKS